MAAIVVTAAKVGLVDPVSAIVKSYLAAEAITAGEAVYIVAASGSVGLADGNGAGKYQARGIALGSAGIGQAVDVCEKGEVYGFTLAGDYDTRVYVGDTAGALADAAGTKTMVIGRVSPMSDKDQTKVLMVETDRISEVA